MRIISYFLGYAFLNFRMKIHQWYKSHKRQFHVTALAQLTSHHHQKDEALIPPKSPQAVPSLTLHLLWQLPNCTAKAVWVTKTPENQARKSAHFLAELAHYMGSPCYPIGTGADVTDRQSSHWGETAREKGRRHLLFGSTVLLLWLAT